MTDRRIFFAWASLSAVQPTSKFHQLSMQPHLKAMSDLLETLNTSW